MKTDYSDGHLEKNPPGVFYSWMCCLATRHCLCKWTKIRSQLVSKSLTLSEETLDIIPSTNTSWCTNVAAQSDASLYSNIYSMQYTEGSLDGWVTSHTQYHPVFLLCEALCCHRIYNNIIHHYTAVARGRRGTLTYTYYIYTFRVRIYKYTLI